MSLVAYESSDSDDNSEEEKIVPAPISSLSFVKKSKETVRKITIPSLNEFAEDEAQTTQSTKPTIKKGSSLFSLLPPPKYTTETKSFTPHVLTKKSVDKASSIPKKFFKKRTETSTETDNAAITNEPDSVDEIHKDGDSSFASDFFSLDSSSSPRTVSSESNFHSKSTLFSSLPESNFHSKSTLFSSLPEPCESAASQAVSSISYDDASYHASEVCSEPSGVLLMAGEIYSDVPLQSGNEGYQEPANSELSFMEDEGFKKLKGRREFNNIDIIDVNADDQLVDKDQWLIQSLTEEKVVRPSKRRHDMPTSQQKRKHQITYLAFQAKERELDLKNQWAQNSRTKRETQAKYGF